MRQAAVAENHVQRMAAWAGQNAALARPKLAVDLVRRILGRSPGCFTMNAILVARGMARVNAQSLNRDIS